MSEATYTMDEVYEEAKKFARENGLEITSKKGLPKGKCENAEECVLANLFGGNVFEVEFGREEYGVRQSGIYSLLVPFDSIILNRFVADFDNQLYPELILPQS